MVYDFENKHQVIVFRDLSLENIQGFYADDVEM